MKCASYTGVSPGGRWLPGERTHSPSEDSRCKVEGAPQPERDGALQRPHQGEDARHSKPAVGDPAEGPPRWPRSPRADRRPALSTRRGSLTLRGKFS